MVLLDNILIATDFSEPSEAALAYGRELARTFGARMHVLHVTEEAIAAVGVASWPPNLPKLQAEIDEQAWHRLNAILVPEDRARRDVRAIVRHSWSIATAIVDYARREQIDLIVVGTHGRRGPSRALIGSVAERVVRTAPCPVLAVRRPEHDFLTGDALVTVAAR